jgi:hypothetical protein
VFPATREADGISRALVVFVVSLYRVRRRSRNATDSLMAENDETTLGVVPFVSQRALNSAFLSRQKSRHMSLPYPLLLSSPHSL